MTEEETMTDGNELGPMSKGRAAVLLIISVVIAVIVARVFHLSFWQFP
jgi:hypothetical protein